MNCHVCGAFLEPIITDLPFKISNKSIIILKRLPVLQCTNCQEFLIEDSVMERVEQVLAKAGDRMELEVVEYAA